MPFSGKLNKEQNEAVTHAEGPLLILAGAGSGKTRTITHRIAYLLDKKKASPYSILAVTFTNKAANEMKTRINKLVKSGIKGLWMGTFHSVCLRILKRDIEHLKGFKANFTIFDDQDQVRLIKDCLKLLDLNERVYEPRAMRSKIDGFKNRGSQLKDIKIETHDERIRDIYELYEDELRRHNGLDFSDLLSLTVKLFKEHPNVLEFYQDRFNHILVDEYQDTNNLQYQFVKSLAEKNKNIFVVGDDNQSIYSWRGADIQNILNFEGDFSSTKVIKLEKNYRSTKNILNISNELIKNNLERKEKTLYTDNENGELINYYEAADEQDEAKHLIRNIDSQKKEKGLQYNDIAIFYRTNNQSKALEDELILSGRRADSERYSLYHYWRRRFLSAYGSKGCNCISEAYSEPRR
jgi:DNA helicase-2/ATP-dependent DNA helicase PcrA